MTGWPALAVITACALVIFGAGYLQGFCHGRYGWRRPVPLPRIVRRRPADVWPTHAAEREGVTFH